MERGYLDRKILILPNSQAVPLESLIQMKLTIDSCGSAFYPLNKAAVSQRSTVTMGARTFDTSRVNDKAIQGAVESLAGPKLTYVISCSTPTNTIKQWVKKEQRGRWQNFIRR